MMRKFYLESKNLKIWLLGFFIFLILCGCGGTNRYKNTSNQYYVEPLHSWTDTKGRTFTASFVSSDGKTVKIKYNGRVFYMPISSLSPQSQELARKLSAPSNRILKGDLLDPTKYTPFPDGSYVRVSDGNTLRLSDEDHIAFPSPPKKKRSIGESLLAPVKWTVRAIENSIPTDNRTEEEKERDTQEAIYQGFLHADWELDRTGQQRFVNPHIFRPR